METTFIHIYIYIYGVYKDKGKEMETTIMLKRLLR